MTKFELQQYLVEETENFTWPQVEKMNGMQLLTHWLEYNGICGYTADIMEVVEAAFDVELNFDEY